MKRFGTILKFELKGYFRNKIFVGVTAFLVVAIIAVMFFPRIMDAFDNESNEPDIEMPGDTSPDDDAPVMLLLSSGGDQIGEDLRAAFSAAFTDYNVTVSEDDIETVKDCVSQGDIDCAFLFRSLTDYTYYVNNLSLYDSNTYVADEVLVNLYRMNAMIDGGLSPETAGEILSVVIDHDTETLGQDQMQNYFYTYIMVYSLYIVIMLYGQLVATSVATEKSSRAMELLITSTKPVAMMFGKVTAACIAGLSQLFIIFGAALVSFELNQSYWGGNEIIRSIFDMPPELLVYMLVFFVLGFLVYAFLYGAIGSTASKLEDINTSVMPVTFLFIAGFIIVVIGMASYDVDSLLMRVSSYIPFFSPMAMFTRIAMSTVPAYEIAISIAILAASVVGIGVISAKIYRAGVLLYGTPPKPSAILKAIRKA